MKNFESNKIKERLEKRKKAALESAVSYMSNTKWRKLISSIDSIEHLLTGSNWNLIWNEEIISENEVPNSEDVLTNHLVDGTFYYVGYDDIVWLELVTKEPDTVLNYFSAIAKFELTKSKKGVKIHGYKLNA